MMLIDTFHFDKKASASQKKGDKKVSAFEKE